MPAISTNDLKNGITLELDNGLFQVVEFQHVKPGKGGAFVRSKLRNLKNGNVLERTFNAGVRVEQALLDKKDMQFLYRDGDEYVFMDTESYDQMNVAPVALGDAADYLVEQAVAIIAFYNGEIVTVEIPASVELTIADTEPGIQGDRVSGARKPATLETGKVAAGAAVHQPRRPGQGRHPLRRLHHPGLSPWHADASGVGRRSTTTTRTDARERAMILLYEADSKASPSATSPTAQVVEPDALTRLLVEGVEEHRDRARRR